ncbi:MAG: A/G-specific adenine glycosylase [Oligoflexia bacterium]|nr:A/G-specific adenine glycosylase [Oligoflexia bacterium]
MKENLLELAAWFERQKRVLPWRDRPTVYRVWISEIMLQQTQVATVVPYFERFIRRFGSVEELAAASEAEVLEHWAGLGYYSRARNLLRAARLIAEAGAFPSDRTGWLEIPGVGDYTAGAILSIALDRPEAILDGNVERVVSRVRRVDREDGDGVFKETLWRHSRRWVALGFGLGIRPSVLNQALMELGATVCSPREPRCGACPLASICRARKAGVQKLFPPRKRPVKWVSVREEVHCVLDNRGNVLLRQRGTEEWCAGLWDLPLGKPAWIAAGARPLDCFETRHVVTRHRITRITRVWRVSGAGCGCGRGGVRGGVRGAPRSAGRSAGDEFRWVPLAEPGVAAGAALKKVLRRVQESGLGSG